MNDAILFWNEVSLEAVAQDHTFDEMSKRTQNGPTRTSRALAIVHLAMYDAFNSIAKVFVPYLPNLPLPASGASRRAAIGEAAFVTLASLYPSQQAFFQQKSQEFFAALNTTTQSIDNGQAQGRRVAEALLKARANDGSSLDLPYNPSQEPGRHRVDPLNAGQGFLGASWGQVQPFALNNAKDFIASPPPDLNSMPYANSFNDVKAKGIKTGGTRTPAETTIGIFWGYDGAKKLGTPPRLYNQIVRVIAMQQGNDLAKNVRLFALVNTAMADAAIQCWLSKYFYNIWRPVVGVREADLGWGPTGKGDGNSGTQVDPSWLPLGAPKTNEPGKTNFTPNFPAYPSGHATFGAASLGMVRLFYGTDNISFNFVSDEFNGESIDIDGTVRAKHTRHFTSLSQAILENARSRVYLGVHWQFDADGGAASGEQLTQYIFNNALKPI
jgi:PAP2 superfamily/Vanadium chloroperoxidase N-terminal domain